MQTLYFDVEKGELHICEKDYNLIISLLKTSDGNYSSVLTPESQLQIIQKLVADMQLK